MLQKHTEPYPNEDEPYLFSDMPGHYFAFNFSVLENEEADLTGAPVRCLRVVRIPQHTFLGRS